MSAGYDTHTTADVLVTAFAAQIAGKVVLTTGVSPGGLGAHFAQQTAAAKPRLLILAGRNAEKTQQTADAISATSGVATRALALDLASLEAVRKAAAEVNAWDDVPAIDVLVNNAGIMACAYGTTVDGYEQQFAVNHLAHFLFTNLIIKKLLAAPESRVVSVSSDGHRLSQIRWADYNFHGGETYNKWRAYGQSKTANTLFAVSLAEKLGSKGLTAISLHPGVVGTHLGDHVDWKTEFADLNAVDKELGNQEGWSSGFDFQNLDRGAATHVYAAFDPVLKKHNGGYVLDSHLADPAKDTYKAHAFSPIEAAGLWKLSEKLVGEKFSY